MNALEMAGMAMVERLVNNLPEEKKQQIGQIIATALGIQTQLDRIENQNRLIIAHLKIPDDAVITEHHENAGRTG